jgi:hypothetical protein
MLGGDIGEFFGTPFVFRFDVEHQQQPPQRVLEAGQERLVLT